MRALLAVPVALLAACGFHFAGSRPLPAALSSVYIDVVAPYQVAEPPLETALIARLRRRGADVAGTAGAASATLRLTDLNEKREVLSVGPDGKALEFQLTTRVTYTVLAGGKVLVAPDSLGVSRDYSFNAQQVLAKEAEEARLQRFMQDELAELLLLRLEAVLNQASEIAAPAAKPDV